MQFKNKKRLIKALCSLCCFISIVCFAQKNLPDPCGTHGMHPSDCNRSTPTKVINDSVFPGNKFLLSKDSMSGYNWVNFKNGDKLLLVNCGCTEYTYVFQFTTSRFSADTTNYTYWYPVAAELMAEAAVGIYKNDPIPVQQGVDTLKSFIRQYPNKLKLNYVLFIYYSNTPNAATTYDDDDDTKGMTPHMLITRIQKKSDSEYMVEVTYSIGL
ncbi:MAG TPA: hypothetical protein VNY36_09055 [Bacteroidia bacterium]|nr:hypothetical protein [Bacteroidia bacterium]